MPHILPAHEGASWPANEGVIGVVGVAPWATIAFLEALYSQISAVKDWDFPRVIADINTKLPSRGRYFDLGERDPSPFIQATIAELAAQGATVAVVPCNTAHILYERWVDQSPIPVPHILTATVAELKNKASTVACLASRSLSAQGTYDAAIVAAGMKSERLRPNEVEVIDAAISHIKREGGLDDLLEARLEALLGDLAGRGVDGIILGCTELKCLEPLCQQADLVCAESNTALARAALAIARHE